MKKLSHGEVNTSPKIFKIKMVVPSFDGAYLIPELQLLTVSSLLIEGGRHCSPLGDSPRKTQPHNRGAWAPLSVTVRNAHESPGHSSTAVCWARSFVQSLIRQLTYSVGNIKSWRVYSLQILGAWSVWKHLSQFLPPLPTVPPLSSFCRIKAQRLRKAHCLIQNQWVSDWKILNLNKKALWDKVRSSW